MDFLDQGTLIELFGYLGSTLVVVSMLMASVVRLRVINTVGSVISGTYALIIASFPLALMNGCLIVINVYNLMKLLRDKQQYDMVSCEKEDSYIRYFLERYIQDIRKFFPEFTTDSLDSEVAFLVCCQGNPAGILLGKLTDDGSLDVVLDYSVPAYRDCSVGKFLYARLPAAGIQSLTFRAARSEDHARYLKKMGFTEARGAYTRKLG